VTAKDEKAGLTQLRSRYGMSSVLRRIILWVFTGARGGPNRARVVATLKDQRMNANQLAQKLGMDYKTIRHHLKVLTRNHLIVEAGDSYGTIYFISPEFEQEYDEFLRIWNKIKPSD